MLEVRIVAQLVSVDEYGGTAHCGERTVITINRSRMKGMSLAGIAAGIRAALDIDAVFDLAEDDADVSIPLPGATAEDAPF